MLRPLLQGSGQGGTRSRGKRGRGFFCLGGLLRIPAFESLAVLFAGEVADQAFDHRSGVGIPFCQIDKRTAQDDLVRTAVRKFATEVAG